jgi:phage shock protein A
LIATGHQALDAEYRKGVIAVSAASTSFTGLSNRVVQEIERLPNPAERLQSLWTGVESLDQRLRSSIGDAGTQLATIGTQAQTTAASIERLSQSVRAAADRIERGGGEIGATLERELRDLSKVLDDFYGLLDERVKMIGAR